MGSLQNGQTRTVVVSMDIEKNDAPYVNFNVKYVDPQGCVAMMDCIEGKEFKEEDAESSYQFARCLAVTAIAEAIQNGNLSAAHSSVKDVIAKIKAMPATKSKNAQALLQDLDGQVLEALSKSEYFERWGKHYLPSLCRAHQLQFCNNFKDPGVQVYGGKCFEKMRDFCDDVFLKLPLPKPSRPITKGSLVCVFLTLVF